ncbi:tetratricopeptide repeat protein (plasmid) [Saccharothrix sp. AJ9571]|nr:tetratricopeptide repeat protein [Saccharothrix sp. AJ9571]
MADITGLRNPYDYANPVRADKYFAGRGVELAKIDYLLEHAGVDRPLGYLALYGRRAAGKTSLLNMTEKLAVDRGYLAVRVNLVPADADPTRFFATVYEELIGAVAAVSDLAGPDGRKITPRIVRRIFESGQADDDFPLEFPESLAHAVGGGHLSEMALRNDLSYLGNLIGKPIVLLVDEAQLIANRPDALSLLRALGMRLTGYVLVLAGTTELVEQINEVFDFLLRQFEFVKVERFTETSEVAECMTLPLQAAGLATVRCFRFPVNNVADDLMPLTDGNPYEIQLFCHVMFTRWQTGATDRMDLTAEAIDDVQSTLDVVGRQAERPLVNAVRQMPDDELLALNTWCSSLERATVDEVRFACQVSGLIDLDVDVLNRYLDKFISDGLVELVNNRIRLIGDAAEHIYARLSAVRRLGKRAPILIRRIKFVHLLTDELNDLLAHGKLGGPRWVLRSCCAFMAQDALEQGTLDLSELPRERKISYTVQYLHEAMLESGVPQALHLTTVTCSYGETTATRWICRAASDDFDLGDQPVFLAARQRITELGGTLRAHRTTIQLRPMTEIVDWLVDRFTDSSARDHMAHLHASVALDRYKAGDTEGTFTHLDAGFRLAPQWQSANNLAYLKLVAGNHTEARAWALRAAELGKTAEERALSQYNAGVAAALVGKWADARTLFAKAASDLEHRSPLEDEDMEIAYLVVLSYDARVLGHEESDVVLADEIARAHDVVKLAELTDRMRDSP